MLTPALTKQFEDIFNSLKNETSGTPAQYIPELAKVNPDQFTACVVDVQGHTWITGDTEACFTLQSTSKPFLYALACQQQGIHEVHQHVGVEPTGEVFNSIIELEEKHHRPFNPMINSGAIATTGLLRGETWKAKRETMMSFFNLLTDAELTMNDKVFQSEKSTAHRNRAIAYLMKHFSVMNSDIEETLDLYFQQCSVEVTTKQLALAAATLANKGVHPTTQKKVLDPAVVTKTLSLMFTCGMYDSAGEWAFNVGIPAKSGVSGALFASLPGKFGVAVFSPRINSHGHSVRGQRFLELVSEKLNLHIFN